MIATTRSERSVSEPTLYVAFELSKKEWKLAVTDCTRKRQEPRWRFPTSGRWRLACVGTSKTPARRDRPVSPRGKESRG